MVVVVVVDVVIDNVAARIAKVSMDGGRWMKTLTFPRFRIK